MPLWRWIVIAVLGAVVPPLAVTLTLPSALAALATTDALVGGAPLVTVERDGARLVVTLIDQSHDEQFFVLRHRTPDGDEFEARRFASYNRSGVGRVYVIRFETSSLGPGRHCFVALAAGGAGPATSAPVCTQVPWLSRARPT
jgi:hypothetical protein